MPLFELIEPSNETIDIFLNLRKEQETKSVVLFANHPPVDVSNYQCIKNNHYEKDDKDILTLVNKIIQPSSSKADFQIAVKKINDVYNTMMDDDEVSLTASNLFNKRDTISQMFKDEKYIDVVNYISTINRPSENYTYSFATKLCSFIKEDSIPIFDSYASTLICAFLKNKGKKASHSNMGLYEYYKEKYDEFILEHKIDDKHKYKNIDKFIWLYGKVIQEYWKKSGIISFSSVYYKEPQNDNIT